MSNQLVSSLTVNELKDLITSIIDARIDNLVKSLSTSYTSEYFINKQKESLGNLRLNPKLIG
jgi:ERCC4-type nuclease